MARIIKKASSVKTPRRSTEFSAGYDVFTAEEIKIKAGEEVTVDLPIGVNFDKDVHKVCLFLRSSIGIKKDLRLLNEGEVVPYIELPSDEEDSSVGIGLRNAGQRDFVIEKDMHFAQFIVMDKDESYCNFLAQKIEDEKGDMPVSLSIEETRRGAHWVLQEQLVLEKGESLFFSTGYKVKIDQDCFLGGFVPEGEERFVFSNGSIVGDSDFYDNEQNSGNYSLKIDNITDDVLVLEIGTPIAEIISIPYYTVEDEIVPTDKRKGGIGSTTETEEEK